MGVFVMARGSGNRVSTSISLDRDVKERLDDLPVNRSELANRVFREYIYGSNGRLDGLKFREKMLEQEIEELEDRLDEKRSQLEKIQQEREESADIDDELQEAFDILDSPAKSQGGLDPDNPAVQNWASKLGMRPKELIDRYRQYSENSVEAAKSVN